MLFVHLTKPHRPSQTGTDHGWLKLVCNMVDVHTEQVYSNIGLVINFVGVDDNFFVFVT